MLLFALCLAVHAQQFTTRELPLLPQGACWCCLLGLTWPSQGQQGPLQAVTRCPGQCFAGCPNGTLLGAVQLLTLADFDCSVLLPAIVLLLAVASFLVTGQGVLADIFPPHVRNQALAFSDTALSGLLLGSHWLTCTHPVLFHWAHLLGSSVPALQTVHGLPTSGVAGRAYLCC